MRSCKKRQTAAAILLALMLLMPVGCTRQPAADDTKNIGKASESSDSGADSQEVRDPDLPQPEQLMLPERVEVRYPDGSEAVIRYEVAEDGSICRTAGEETTRLRLLEDGTVSEETLLIGGRERMLFTYAYEEGLMTGNLGECTDGEAATYRFVIGRNDLFDRQSGSAVGFIERDGERLAAAFLFTRDESGRLTEADADYMGERRLYEYRENGFTLTLLRYGVTVATAEVDYLVDLYGRVHEKTVEIDVTPGETAPDGWTEGVTHYAFSYGAEAVSGRYCAEICFLRFEDYLRHFIDQYY